MSDDPGILRLEHLYHLYGTKDPLQGLGAKLYPGRWPSHPLSSWNRALADKRITQAQYEQAKAAPLGLHIEPAPNVIAPYFVEEVRRQLESQYGSEQLYGAGMKIYTTLDLAPDAPGSR